jgi:putative selenate reductase
MRPLSFAALMERVLGEFAQSGSIMGIRAEKFYRNVSGRRVRLFDTELDSLVGPAAGPGSQLAGNIIASYLAGSRFIEVKTVQTMDGAELAACVARPCINAADECYNVEWSTELTVQQAFDEYVRAWVACHVLGKELGLGCGIVFNMSVGYSLEGIQSAKIDAYIEGMKDASGSAVWTECQDWLRDNSGRFEHVSEADVAGISPTVSNSITLSTLHGCPADEIERIAHYLLTEKHLHTYVKCNPTLLGYERARTLLDALGYGYLQFDDHHFLEDLQFGDAVAMFERLLAIGQELGLAVGAKITNTFPVKIGRNELPGDEMYMSGRSLFPLSLMAASLLSECFEGQLPISYSGGIDAFNIEAVLACGIRPLTVATTALKPGGYERMCQLARLAETVVETERQSIAVEKLAALTLSVSGGEATFARHRKDYRVTDTRKGDEPLALFDCAQAPCSTSGCPIHQQIPAYLEQVANDDMAAAFRVIVNDNVLPSVTGTICDHQCQNRCTRLDYDDPLQIRAAKKAASVMAQAKFVAEIKQDGKKPGSLCDARVLVIGAGPAGLAAASYLARNGVAVTVRERLAKPMGIVSHVIPTFRIRDDEIALDVALAEAYGVDFEFNAPANYDLQALRADYDFVIVATGAWLPGTSDLKIDGVRVIDALDFLARFRYSDDKSKLGRRVAVIGGGDVAMDCVRTATRITGVERAAIVYRRTREQMPAQREERELAEADGVEFLELLAPRKFDRATLSCDVMALGDYDASGRRGVFATGEKQELDFDVVISAVGARVDATQFAANGLALDTRGFCELSDQLETSLPGVYVAGDCKAGPQTVVRAMADAKLIVLDILSKLEQDLDFQTFEPQACREELLLKKGVLTAADTAPQADASRCLSCNSLCEVCVDVCPNRANIAIAIGADFSQPSQILHLDRLCNECGNCAVFCPTAGKPYLDKPTLFATVEDFEDSSNQGFLPLDNGCYRLRLANGVIEERATDDPGLSASWRALGRVVTSTYDYLLT